MFQIKPEAVFKLEQLLWKLVGWWPGSARRRLWLPHPVVEVRPAKHFLTIFVIVRNEAPYIDEWIEFHRMMGVSHFFIYDNGSSDDTVDRLSSYVDAGLVTVVRWADFLKGWEGVAGTGGRIQKLGHAALPCQFWPSHRVDGVY